MLDFGVWADGISYQFFLEDFSRRQDIEGEIRRRVWYRFRDEGIAFPARVGQAPPLPPSEEALRRDRALEPAPPTPPAPPETPSWIGPERRTRPRNDRFFDRLRGLFGPAEGAD